MATLNNKLLSKMGDDDSDDECPRVVRRPGRPGLYQASSRPGDLRPGQLRLARMSCSVILAKITLFFFYVILCMYLLTITFWFALPVERKDKPMLVDLNFGEMMVAVSKVTLLTSCVFFSMIGGFVIWLSFWVPGYEHMDCFEK